MNPNVDLESAITKVWQTSDDLALLFRYMLDAPKVMTEDEIANTVLGIQMLHEMRMWELDDTHCRKMELNQYCTDPVKLAAREPKKGKKK